MLDIMLATASGSPVSQSTVHSGHYSSRDITSIESRHRIAFLHETARSIWKISREKHRATHNDLPGFDVQSRQCRDYLTADSGWPRQRCKETASAAAQQISSKHLVHCLATLLHTSPAVMPLLRRRMHSASLQSKKCRNLPRSLGTSPMLPYCRGPIFALHDLFLLLVSWGLCHSFAHCDAQVRRVRGLLTYAAPLPVPC